MNYLLIHCNDGTGLQKKIRIAEQIKIRNTGIIIIKNILKELCQQIADKNYARFIEIEKNEAL